MYNTTVEWYKKSVIEITISFSVVIEKNRQRTLRFHISILPSPHKKTDRLILHDYWRGNNINITQNIIFFHNFFIHWQDILGQCTLILMTILPIPVKYMIKNNNINAHIKRYHGYPRLTLKGIMITWINNNIWEMLKHFSLKFW